MSAECYKCGCDIIYPGDTWPVGECPRCDKPAGLKVHDMAGTEWSVEYVRLVSKETNEYRDISSEDFNAMLNKHGPGVLRD